MTIPLISEDEIVSKKRESVDVDVDSGWKRRKVVKTKPEKPVLVVRIKYYEKLSLDHMKNSKSDKKDIFAVNRGLEDLLKALYYNTQFEMVPPADCIYVEKDNRMGSTDKYIFIDINKEEAKILKRQLENPTVIYAYNKGELLISEGRRSYLSDVWGAPRIWR